MRVFLLTQLENLILFATWCCSFWPAACLPDAAEMFLDNTIF